MSKKKLLEESTIRSFMKLANLQPLTSKFLKESEHEDGESEEEEDSKEEKDKKEEGLQEEVVEEDQAQLQEADDGDDTANTVGRPAPTKQENHKTLTPTAKKGVSGADSVKGNAKLSPAPKTHNHTAKGANVTASEETGPSPNGRKKNNKQQEVVTENLEEVEMATDAEDEMTGSDAAGESEQHQESVKDAIQKILGAVSQIAQEYGVEMDVQSGEEEMSPEEEAPADMSPEVPGAEDEKMMEEKLDQMVEKLTKRVAARLVKETKAKR